MTFAPATIRRLAEYWVSQGGINLGIVGDAAHQRRASYHNGQDVITANGRTAANDYSIRLFRDREPYLTNAAAALDLGRLGSLAGLQDFSNWLVAACIRDPEVRRDIREVIYSPDGKVVQRYSGPDNAVRVDGDDSHLWHTHISFYRDSEQREKVHLFEPYFELPDTDTEDTLGPTFEVSSPIVGVATTTQVISIIPTDGAEWKEVPSGYVRNVSAVTTITNGRYEGKKAYLVAVPDGPPGSMGLLLATAATFRSTAIDEDAVYNAGVTAASKAALAAKR